MKSMRFGTVVALALTFSGMPPVSWLTVCEDGEHVGVFTTVAEKARASTL